MAVRSSGVVSAVLAAVLLALGATAGWSVVAIGRSTDQMTRATEKLEAYADLQRAVGGQAFAEAGHRRAPGPGTRARVDRAVADVADAVEGVRAVGGERDGALMSYVTLVNDRYVVETRRTLGPDGGTTRDDRVAGPALDAVQRLIDGAVAGHRERVATVREDQQQLTRQLQVAVPAVLLVGFAALLLCWRLLLTRQRRLAESAAAHESRALHDPLTGLANRDLFRREAEAALAEGPCVVLLGDLDDFKLVNDSLGHQAGDTLLTQVAARGKGALRERDVAARLGGDEFAFLLRDARDARVGTARLTEAVGAPLLLDETLVTPAMSLGCAVAPTDGTDVDALLAAADRDLYRNKRQRRASSARRP